MTLPIAEVKRGHRGKSKNDKGLLNYATPEQAPVEIADSTERVLATVKGLKEDYERHYAEIESRVKKSLEGPVKTFTMDDGIPIVMQLSVWDTKLGPVNAMMVGDADLMVSIPADEIDASTRMMDVLAAGDTCDLSKDLGRLMVKFGIADPAIRGGEAWLLVAGYLDLTMDVPRATIRELLAQTAACWHDDASLATEAMAIRDQFDIARSRWLMYLTELRRSIWSIVQKSREVIPARPIPDIDIPAIADALSIPEPASDDTTEASEPEQDAEPEDKEDDGEPRPPNVPNRGKLGTAIKNVMTKKRDGTKKHVDVVVEPDAEPDEASSKSMTSETSDVEPDAIEPADEPVPIRLLPARAATARDDDRVTPAQPAKIAGKTKAIEPAIIDVLGKLQRSGCSVKVDKDSQDATAFRLVELEPGKGGLIGLAYSFHAGFLAFPILHVIDGTCYAGDDRATIEPCRPQANAILHDHLPSSEEVVYRGKLFGRVHHDRALKPIVVPIMLVRQAIKDADGDMPFCWIEPSGNGVHGYFVVVAGEIDAFDTFIMNALRVLGPRMADAEAEHVATVTRDIKQANITGRGAFALVVAASITGILAGLHVLPLDMTISLLQYWYVVAIIAIGGIIGMGYVYHGLDTKVGLAMTKRANAVAQRTPFLVKPGWEDIVPAARRIGKALFPHFNAAFCQDLDTAAIDEATEVVFRQETSPSKPVKTKVFTEMNDIATKTKVARNDDVITQAATSSRPGLKITDARTIRRKPRDDDILNDEPDTDDGIEPTDPGTSVRIDPLEALRDK